MRNKSRYTQIASSNHIISILIIVLTMATLCCASNYQPIGLHPDNPHYFLWRGRPTVLITSGEHYGAVLNKAFDYKKYLRTLQNSGFNLTRTFSGAYCEPTGAFKIKNNTLSPDKGQLLCPWARSQVPGYANGGNKFDLSRWDPAYFHRLKDFLAEAARRGIVVELVLFCPFYREAMWRLSPMNASNNINGIGNVPRTEVYTLKHPKLLAVQEAMVRKIVTELRDFDNLYYEICNEPYFGGVTLQWQARIAAVIAETERKFHTKHLIAQNIANKTKKITNPNPLVSIFNFHYAKPPTTVADNYHLNLPIADDETGFAGSQPKPYRIEGWDFMLAGGAVYSNLDYSFTVGCEDGTAKIDAPGGGGPTLRKQLKILKDLLESFDFIAAQPLNRIIKTKLPPNVTARALVIPGRDYIVYLNGQLKTPLDIELPAGTYLAQWINTKTGRIDHQFHFSHTSGTRTLSLPPYQDDIALRIRRNKPTKSALLFEGDFETGDLSGWSISGNSPTASSEHTRAGRYAMKTTLDRYKDKVSYRTEVSGPSAKLGGEYWYGFSIYLPKSYVPDKIWEIVAQWHGVPDFDIEENWRNPVMALSTTAGRWSLRNRADAKPNTFAHGKKSYTATNNYDLGPYQTGKWTDWVIHVKWSYKDDGLLEVWKDGTKVITQTGPNAFNDKHGPYFKMGLYKGWKNPKTPCDAVSRRVLYHDEFRLASAPATYKDVAPASRR